MIWVIGIAIFLLYPSFSCVVVVVAVVIIVVVVSVISPDRALAAILI